MWFFNLVGAVLSIFASPSRSPCKHCQSPAHSRAHFGALMEIWRHLFLLLEYLPSRLGIDGFANQFPARFENMYAFNVGFGSARICPFHYYVR